MTNPSHAVLVAHRFPPDGSAGVERYTARLGSALQGRGWRVTVVTGRLRPGLPQNSVEQTVVDGLDVVGIVQNWPYRDLPEAVVDPALDRVFTELLDELAPDVVAFQSLHGLSWGWPGIASAAGARVALHLHDAEISCASGGQRLHPDGELCLPVDPRRCGACFDRYRHREGLLERAGRWAAARLPGAVPPDALHRAFAALPSGVRDGLKVLNEKAGRARATEAPREETLDPRIVARREAIDRALEHVDVVISPSAFLAESLRGDGLAADVTLARTGGPALGRRPVPKSDRLRVLFLGTWVRHKGPHVLAEALAQLGADHAARIRATARGPAPFPAYRDEVAEAAAGRLTVGGPVEAADVPALIAAHDVLVVPSIWAENAPLVVLEARALGRPILASDLGGLVELVGPDDGLRFPAGDASALAALLVRLLDEPGLLAALQASVRPPPSEDDQVSAIVHAWTAP